ncbi:hypothetical protein KQI84_14165 [bacterium]|nr:hypothetical protein [bacterium]
MADTQFALMATAASIGFIHTVIGPDHYVPFIAMARAGKWSFKKTMTVTFLCGIGHVFSSVLLGFAGIGLGLAVGHLTNVESFRGDWAGWLLLGFGIAYMAWGIHRAIRNKPHTHLHVHGDGTVHTHEHTHHEEHVHVHEAPAKTAKKMLLFTPWALFVIFIFGPCEPLIPLLMYPAAEGSLATVFSVATIFAIATIGTMSAIVVAGYFGLGALAKPLAGLERYNHVIAGFVIVLCGAAIKIGL